MKKLLPLLILITFLGCKKEDVESNNNAQLLLRNWKMTGWTVLTPLEGTPLAGVSTNWMGASACVSDKIQRFNKDGSFLHAQASTCTGDRDYNGVWTFSDNNTTVNVKYVGGGYADFSYKIMELNVLKLRVHKLEKTSTSGGEMSLLMEYEFQAQ